MEIFISLILTKVYHFGTTILSDGEALRKTTQ